MRIASFCAICFVDLKTLAPESCFSKNVTTRSSFETLKQDDTLSSPTELKI